MIFSRLKLWKSKKHGGRSLFKSYKLTRARGKYFQACARISISLLGTNTVKLCTRIPRNEKPLGGKRLVGSSNWFDLFGGAFCLAVLVSFGLVLFASQLPLLRNQKRQPAQRPSPRTPSTHAPAFQFSVSHLYTKYEERWKKLTDREKQVARLAAQGKRNADIARELVVSERTVGNHLQSVFDKLGIHSRGELKHILPNLESDFPDEDTS